MLEKGSDVPRQKALPADTHSAHVVGAWVQLGAAQDQLLCCFGMTVSDGDVDRRKPSFVPASSGMSGALCVLGVHAIGITELWGPTVG